MKELKRLHIYKPNYLIVKINILHTIPLFIGRKIKDENPLFVNNLNQINYENKKLN
jgi:hypothetical protein